MGIIKNLPILDRPREKALRYGLSSLSDIELLAVILGGGYRDNSATELSASLLSKYGGLAGLSNVQINELKKNKGVKNVKALNVASVFEISRRLAMKNSEQNECMVDEEYLFNKYKSLIIDEKQEYLFLIVLNSKKHIVHEKTLSKGSEDSVLFSFTDIYREVINHNGKYYYLIHNHTNGNVQPSERDIIITRYVKNESKKAKIILLDHLIIAPDSYYSFQKNEKN